MSYRRRFSFLGFFLLLIALIFSLSNSYASDNNIASAEATATSCRYGVGASGGEKDTIRYVDSINAGWFLDFTQGPKGGHPAINADFVRVVRIQQEKNSAGEYLDNYKYRYGLTAQLITDYAKATPGQLWLIGNEPDRMLAQDDIMPKFYAKIYHDTYQLIKSADPTARVGIAGLVQVSPGRLQYLDIIWDEYKRLYGTEIPVDVWNIHTYPLAEWRPSDPNDPYNPKNGEHDAAAVALGTDLELALLIGNLSRCGKLNDQYMCTMDHANPTMVKHQVETMRQWMANKNLQSKPLIISEMGILWYYQQLPDGSCQLQDEAGNCYDRARTLAFMKDMNTYLETKTDATIGNPNDGNKLVQQWLWFSMFDGDYNTDALSNSSNLLENGYLNMAPGTAASLSPIGVEFKDAATKNANQFNLAVTNVSSIQAVGTENVQIRAKIYNNGNVTIDTPVTVTFYSDAAMTQPIGTKTITPPLIGCAMNSYDVAIDWTVPTSAASVRVKVESTVTETNQSDNIGSTQVLVANYQVFLPVIRR